VAGIYDPPPNICVERLDQHVKTGNLDAARLLFKRMVTLDLQAASIIIFQKSCEFVFALITEKSERLEMNVMVKDMHTVKALKRRQIKDKARGRSKRLEYVQQ